jgi:Zn-dependent protease with chaperone function
MDSIRFNALVSSLEELARRDPAALRRKIKGLIALGYAYVLGILVIIIGLIVTLVLLSLEARRSAGLWKLILALGVLAFVILRALWVRVEHPDGERLTQRDTPKLFHRVEEIRKALKAPRPDVVLLTQEFNASVTQIPRFGIFGGERTYLILGLPLMYALGPRQLDAVLGHEFGHLSGSHPKYGLWVFRVGAVWGRLLGQLEQSRSWFNHVFDWFFKWYVPRLNAHGFALRRDDEYAADVDAARVTSQKLAAQALASMAVRSPVYDAFWQGINGRVEQDPEPPARTWTRLPDAIKEGESNPERATWLATALAQENLVEDSHPALRHRLKALKAVKEPVTAAEPLLADLVPAIPISAATHYLGNIGADRLVGWERQWRQVNAEPWRAAHKEFKKVRAEVAGLIARDDGGQKLSTADLWTVAAGLERLDGDDAAFPWLQRVVAADQKHAQAHFTLGRILLSRRDRAGETLIKRAMAIEPGAIPAGNAILRQFHASVGDKEAVLRTDAEGDKHFEHLQKVVAEREGLQKKDTLAPAVLSMKERKAVEEAAKGEGIDALWVARKVTKLHADRPMLVILVEPKKKFASLFGDRRNLMAQHVLDTLSFDEKNFLVIAWDENASWVLSKIRAAKGLRVTATGTRTLTKVPWLKANRRALVIAGVGLGVVAWALAGFPTGPRDYPDRIDDPTGVFTAEQRDQWSFFLSNVHSQTGVDLHLVVDSLPAGTDFAAVARELAESRGIGGERDRGSVLALLSLNGGGHIETTAGLASPFPADLAARVIRAHTEGMRTKAPTQASIVYSMRHLVRALQEAALFHEPVIAARSARPDSIRFMMADGTVLAFSTRDPLRLDVKPDPRLDSLLGPGPTPEEALERHRQWLSLPVWQPKARVNSPSSRAFYDKEFEITPAFWELMRDEAFGARMIVETRKDLAIAYSVDSPLVGPLFLRRSAAGWEIDVMEELLATMNLNGGFFTWGLTKRASPFDDAFRDRMFEREGVWRFRDGSNEPLPWREISR